MSPLYIDTNEIADKQDVHNARRKVWERNGELI